MSKQPESERIFYNALASLEAGNYSALKRAREKFPTWEEAFQNHPDQSLLNTEELWEKQIKKGIKLLLFEDLTFPRLLKEIPHPPFGLYYIGDLNKEEKAIAVVGTRKATKYGLSFAHKVAYDLGRRGLTIVSGLALGVDASAHSGALKAEARTIAVFARGLDRVYPPQNHRLAKEILKHKGLIISEYAPGVSPRNHFFLERNRIISGLSLATLVIEAPERSGALATARFAYEQNRDLFVLPGPINNPNFRGAHKLIQGGAALVTGASDILSELGFADELEKQITPPVQKISPVQENILQILKTEAQALHVDRLSKITKLDPQQLQINLSELLLADLIIESGGKYQIK